GLADRGLAASGRIEAPLELVQRVLPAAEAAAEVEAAEAPRLGPFRRLEENEVARARRPGPLARGAEVVVQPWSRRQAEGARDELSVEHGIEDDEALAERQQLFPVGRREEVERGGVLSAHRLLVELDEGRQVTGPCVRRDDRAGRARLADDVAVLRMHPGEQVAPPLEPPADRRRKELGPKRGRRLVVVREQRVKADEARADSAVRAPALVELVEALDRRLLADGDRPSVAVGSGHVEAAARNLAHEAGEDDVSARRREVQEGRPARVEQGCALHVLAQQVSIRK